jgi:hypothetical protein
MTHTIDTVLAPLVNSTKALPGWSFEVTTNHEENDQYELQIMVRFTDSYHSDQNRVVVHCFLIPFASYDYRAWRWWLFQQCMLVQQHELSEFFRQSVATRRDAPDVLDGEFKPFRPNHAAGRNPYQVLEVGTEADAQAPPGSVQMKNEYAYPGKDERTRND